MKTYIIDTSVVIPWFNQDGEKFVDKSRRVLADHKAREILLMTSDLLVIELVNALSLGKKMGFKAIDECIDAFYDAGTTIIPTNQKLIKKSLAIANQWGIIVYDAVFLSLAKFWGCQLISADRKSHGKITDGSVIMLKDYPEI